MEGNFVLENSLTIEKSLLTFLILSVIIVAMTIVAYATIIGGLIMSKFMKMLNNISRSQAIYRHGNISAKDLQTGHYAFVLVICANPGRSQDEIAKELCINKSTVTRNLNCLEEKGYISRTPSMSDRRQMSVYPTEKMLVILPEVKKASEEWMNLLSESIPKDQLAIFDSVLERMESRAREIISMQEESK